MRVQPNLRLGVQLFGNDNIVSNHESSTVSTVPKENGNYLLEIAKGSLPVLLATLWLSY
jgi:hypothetical protein